MKLLKKMASLALAAFMLFALSSAAGAVTLEPSGYEMNLSEYAPVQSKEASCIGGNFSLFTYDDFADLAGGQYESYRDAVNWWLSCGVTNGGETWDYFGVDSPFLRNELAFFLYRFYNITNDDGLWLYDDFSHNPLSGETNWKFTDAVYACRWSGVLGGTDNNRFDPLGSVDTELILTSLYRVLSWSPEMLPDDVKAEIEAQTGKSYTETTTYVCENFPAELKAKVGTVDTDKVIASLDTLEGHDVSDWAREAVAFFVSAGLYEAPEGFDPQLHLGKLDAIELLYTICQGTGARTGDKWALFGSATVINDYAKDAEISGEDFELIGESEDNEIAGTTLIAAHDGAQVTISDSTITTDHVTEGSGYQLAYRWGDSMAVVAYGEGTRLHFENCTFNWLDTVERQHGGLFPTCGATIIVEDSEVSRQSSGMCYNGTLIYKDCDLTTEGTRTGRSHSSDFFSGVTVYDGCTMNKNGMPEASADGSGEMAPTAFNDEAASLYIVNCPYYGDGFGCMTGVATAYVENSTLDATPFSFTNNTSELTDVTSFVVYDSDVRFGTGICTLVKEARVDGRFIDCGEIELGDTLPSGYDITIEGAEFGTYSSLRLRLDGTTFSRALKVYVAPGCELIVEAAPGTELPEIIQDTTQTRDVRSYVMQQSMPGTGYFDSPNTGSVVVRTVDWNNA